MERGGKGRERRDRDTQAERRGLHTQGMYQVSASARLLRPGAESLPLRSSRDRDKKEGRVAVRVRAQRRRIRPSFRGGDVREGFLEEGTYQLKGSVLERRKKPDPEAGGFRG